MRIKTGAGLAAVVLLAGIALSCARSEPRIVFGYIGLVYYQQAEGAQERFTFFVLAEDDEGIDHLSDLFLYHDREQLRWHLNSNDWIRHEQDGRTWIGSRAISVAPGETLPRGVFRAVLVNQGGERSERNFTFDAPETPRLPFPTLAIDEGYFTVNSLYPVNRLVAHDAQGNFMSMVELTSLTGAVAGLGLPGGGVLIALWAEDPPNFTSAFTDAVPLR